MMSDMNTEITEATIELLQLERYAIRIQLEENGRDYDKAYRVENFDSYQNASREIREDARHLRLRVRTIDIMIEVYRNSMAVVTNENL